MVLMQNMHCGYIINISISLLTLSETSCYFIENHPILYQPFAVILPQKFTCSAFAQGLAAENVLLTMQNNFNLLCVSFSTPWFAAERKKTLNK